MLTNSFVGRPGAVDIELLLFGLLFFGFIDTPYFGSWIDYLLPNEMFEPQNFASRLLIIESMSM